MAAFVLAHEAGLRLGIFAAVLAVMAGWEAFRPRRVRAFARGRRWPGNFGIVILNSVLARLLLPAAAVGSALWASVRGFGLFHLLALPGWAAGLSALILLDLAIYLQHLAFHAVPTLWRFHRLHHADPDFDVTTGLRFHPCEILISLLWKVLVVALLGAPPAAVILFEVLLNASSLFTHGNVGLGVGFDRIVRLVFVTPDMHRVHHSVLAEETNSNFGFNLAWWDRLFGTYRAAPSGGQAGMAIGYVPFRDPSELRLDRMLAQPFVGPADAYSFRRSSPLQPR